MPRLIVRLIDGSESRYLFVDLVKFICRQVPVSRHEGPDLIEPGVVERLLMKAAAWADVIPVAKIFPKVKDLPMERGVEILELPQPVGHRSLPTYRPDGEVGEESQDGGGDGHPEGDRCE